MIDGAKTLILTVIAGIITALLIPYLQNASEPNITFQYRSVELPLPSTTDPELKKIFISIGNESIYRKTIYQISLENNGDRKINELELVVPNFLIAYSCPSICKSPTVHKPSAGNLVVKDINPGTERFVYVIGDSEISINSNVDAIVDGRSVSRDLWNDNTHDPFGIANFSLKYPNWSYLIVVIGAWCLFIVLLNFLGMILVRLDPKYYRHFSSYSQAKKVVQAYEAASLKVENQEKP
ncbi:hypothetical protein NGM99_17855 [Mesorhizobium sp. RP14(2022)]|uniref:DUF11 domain-containing protein n=1 Tax=Mesorhizobium liriopis TaxID=2953882 RepID=A0ABT1CAZ3_9HYPH|nr:hypothetical protein [Mesorhizobium liriopis]MCO6051653.1 hypothetical protein [Mesorhizobium liriopis]